MKSTASLTYRIKIQESDDQEDPFFLFVLHFLLTRWPLGRSLPGQGAGCGCTAEGNYEGRDHVEDAAHHGTSLPGL